MNDNSLSRKHIPIEDLASVTFYQSRERSVLEINADPADIYLFCVKKGNLVLQASFIPHPLEMAASEAIFLAFPRGQWNVNLIMEAGNEVFLISMETSSLHRLIAPRFDKQQFDSAPKVNVRDLMRLIPVQPALMFCFDQLIHNRMQSHFRKIFEKAKFLEIFSLLMEAAFHQTPDVCPVAMSPSIEGKLRQVRLHIMEHLDEAPDPDKLAIRYDLPKTTLREGYRYVFGKTLHQFHTDHKLESAMQMLNEGEMLVKEVAFKIGYQNPSHFISAFKKKYGFTPKQYLRQG